MAREWTKEEDAKILRMHRDKTPIEQIAKALKASTSQIRHRVYAYRDKEHPSGEGDDRVEIVYSGDDGKISYIGEKFTTVEELLDYAHIDREIWEVVEVKLNTWEVAGKKNEGQDENGRWKGETLWQAPLRQISVKIRRRAPKHVQDGIRDILSRVPAWRGKLPRPTKVRRSANHLLEVSLYDVHFGKLCWGSETGTDYDLDIARSDYLGAAEDLLARLSGFQIEKVILPVGHDFMNFDNPLKTTTKGTVVESVDDRMQKVFSVAYDALQQVVMKCRDVANVEVLWVPGNHDHQVSWYLCEMLRRVFEGDKYVSVDNSPMKRKYREYGATLIGYDHGESMPLERLPLTMANEAPHGWARCTYRTYRVGHYHKKKQIKWVGNDTFQGVDVTVLPSLSGTDYYHYVNGWVSNHRTAEAALWNWDSGPVGSFSAEARSSIAKRISV